MSPSSRKVLLCLALAVGGCDCDDDGPTDYVFTHVEQEVDFSMYQTFKIADEDSDEFADAGIEISEIPDDVLLHIDTANDQARIELEELGLTEVPGDEEADLVVFSLGSVKTDGAYYWECVPGQWWGWYGWVWDPCAWLVPVYVTYSVGTVALGLADPIEERVPFGGVLQGVADGEGNAEERIRAGVHQMFKEWPEEPPD